MSNLGPEIVPAAQAAEASTADEQTEIARRPNEVKQLVREKFDLTDDQSATID